MAHRQGSLLLLSALSAGVPGWAMAQTTGVMGRVLHEGTREPIVGAVVEILSQSRRAETDSTGAFRIVGLAPQIVTIRLRGVGFRPVERSLNLFAGRVVSADYLMTPAPVALPDVSVREEATSPTARMLEGFESRRRMGIGKFYTEDELSRHLQRQLPDLLRDAPSVRLVRGAMNEYFAANSRRVVTSIAQGRTQRTCFLDIFVDGSVVWSSDRGAQGTPPVDLGHFIPLSDLVGVEVYSGVATVPAEFRRHGSNCGALVFWTRRGGAVVRGTGSTPGGNLR